MAGYLYEKEYEIHYYEVDNRRRVLITSIVDFLGDIATKQSEELGIGIDYLRQNKLAWVLYKWNIDMNKYPIYGDTIMIRTRPASMKKFYAYRTFELFSSEGELLGNAQSIWFLISLERRRPVRINEDIYNFYGLDLKDESAIEIEDIKKPENITIEKMFNVRYSDIDTNQHVNNVKYIAWALEAVPMEIMLKYTLNNIKATYVKETTYGEVVKVFVEVRNEDNLIVCLHKIIDKEEKELTLLKTVWEKVN